MSKVTDWFYNTTLYYKFRHYFIRKKSPLSWIFWGEIMRRESSTVGMYPISIAAVNSPDCAICLNRGAPGENSIEICIYDSTDSPAKSVRIPLSYKSMRRVMKGFDLAYAESFKIIKEELKELHQIVREK